MAGSPSQPGGALCWGGSRVVGACTGLCLQRQGWGKGFFRSPGVRRQPGVDGGEEEEEVGQAGEGVLAGLGELCCASSHPPTPPRLRLTEVVGMGKLGLISPPGRAGLCTPTWQDGQWGLAVAPGLAPR